ncbi:hypothetical protein ACFSHQ_06125 [Gemmobacter lanyuensis]
MRQKEAGACPGARTGPDRGPGEEEVLHRRAAIGMAARRAEDEMLREVVAAADLIPADEVRVVGLQLLRRDDALGEDMAPQAGA